MSTAAELDRRYVWHPFTQMRDWMRSEPLIIAEGRGAVLRDVRGREFLDANASIWTNLHGHRHPVLDAAIQRQLGRLAHCSALGLANEPAARLAEALVDLAQWPRSRRRARRPDAPLEKVFFSDDGSTALEAALKLAWEYSRRVRGVNRPRFLSLQGAYHGDTVGAASLGQIGLFRGAYRGLLFHTDRVMAPYCYRCPFNRAAPARGDAREYRQCRWECVDEVERALENSERRRRPYGAFIYEPGLQGAAGMVAQPEGWLGRVTERVRAREVLLIADEVMTGFGRTGGAGGDPPRYLAGQREGVPPDLLCLAKGLTGGYLPMAATMTTRAIFEAFLGEYDEFKTFFHGHSYTGNPLGAAVALASLGLLRGRASLRRRAALEGWLKEDLETLWALPQVGDVRQVGLVAGVELVKDWRRRTPYALVERAGVRVCEAMARRGVLTRPIGSVIVLMPPYCTTREQLRRMVNALAEGIDEALSGG